MSALRVGPARRVFSRPLPLLLGAFLVAPPAAAQDGGRPVTWVDIMQVRQVEQPSISADGRWVALTAAPDRGDPQVVVRRVDDDTRYLVPLASHPVISPDSRWVAMRLNPSLEEQERLSGDEPPRRGMALLSTADGQIMEFEDVAAFEFDEDGSHMVFHHFPPRDTDEGDDAPGGGDRDGRGEADRDGGAPLVIQGLVDGGVRRIPGVRDFALEPGGRVIAYSQSQAGPGTSGLYVTPVDVRPEAPMDAIHQDPDGHYGSLTWREDAARPELAFVQARENDDGEAGAGAVLQWDGGGPDVLVAAEDAPDGWFVPADAPLRWSDDGASLFFGWRPLWEGEAERLSGSASGGAGAEEARSGEEGEAGEAAFDAYDMESILADRGVDVWHWLDPFIMPQQKVMWPREKDRTYWAVHHLGADVRSGGGRDLPRAGSTVRLADPDLPTLEIPENGTVALARSDVPYRVERTWVGGQSDAYVVDLHTGDRTLVTERLRGEIELSPGGEFVVYWKDGAYHLYGVADGVTRNLTAGFPVPMADEDHDYPEPAPGYGVAGWMEEDRAVLLYDKYDLWRVPTRGGEAQALTGGAGREAQRIFRIVEIEDDPDPYTERAPILLSSYHDLRKNDGFYRIRSDRSGVQRLLEEDRGFDFVAKAEDADRVLFTRESYDEFPDLWVAGADFSSPRKVTDLNPQLAEFAWGSAELVEYRSDDGRPLQGVVIRPGNYQEGRRYPVLVYYYRFMSQRLHEFNDPSVNHRPSFPVYASDGYVVFLPDVRFEVGRPGLASTKSVVPGVQHLIDMGLADPDGIALHGHSWSGYQTAFMVTQTDIFATAVAGAPVGNMTSAYSGIRLGSGVARQFQYEQGQSRLSGSLWEARDEYIDNSPVFFADRINTPMLILHGDEDDAVPWEQSIELYLAMRRLGKETVFLQYRGEPHHPQEYANKLDWSIKMKEWIDHYTRGTPAPAWITEGVPYRGN